MPLPRASLYAQCRNLHVSVWPEALHNTFDLPAFVVRESRNYVIACAVLLRAQDFPRTPPDLERILSDRTMGIANGSKTIVVADGMVLIEPVVDDEALIVAEIDAGMVREQRQNLDQAGHYARPDVLSLNVDRRRQGQVTFRDD